MSILVKAFLTFDSGTEIRRFPLEENVCTNFDYLLKKIRNVFGGVINETPLALAWKDEDGDNITFSSDEELICALSGRKDDTFRVYITKSRNETYEKSEPSQKFDHSDVICDGCDGPVDGIRYKCTVCPNYDLCENCEKRALHSEHPMLRICSPTTLPMPGFFRPLRKLLKQNYNCTPAHKMDCTDQSEDPEKMQAPGGPIWKQNNKKRCRFMQNNDDVQTDEYNPMQGPPFHPGQFGPWMRPGSRFWRKKFMRKFMQDYEMSQKKEIENQEEKDSDKTVSSSEDEKSAQDSLNPENIDFDYRNLPHMFAHAMYMNGGFKKRKCQKIPAEEKKKLCRLGNGKGSEFRKESKNKGRKSEHMNESKFEQKEDNDDDNSLTENIEQTKDQAEKFDQIIPDDDDAKQEEWMLVSDKSDELLASAQPARPEIYPILNEESSHPDPKINKALVQMKSMGFNDEGGWLTKLLESKDGDINKVIDVILPYRK